MRTGILAGIVIICLAGNPERTRNAVTLMSSPDLREWSIRSVVLYHPDVDRHGFQYLDWQFEDNDLVVVSRTAFDDESGGAHNQHDANYITFHRVTNFRKLTMARGKVWTELIAFSGQTCYYGKVKVQERS